MNDHQIQYSCAMPQDEGGEKIATLLSTDRYERTDGYNEQELVTAATLIAADLKATAGIDAPPVYQNLDSFVRAGSDRGIGFRDPIVDGYSAVNCECDDPDWRQLREG